MKRKIRKIIPAVPVNMGGFRVEQPLPAEGIDQIDPFLLIHHAQSTLPGHQHQREVGVGPHPHRGFSPVTFIFKGSIHHRDSLGNDEIVSEGGVQWMNAGKGITHSERPSKKEAQEGGETEFIQFWVNSPAKHKMAPATYLPMHAEEMPRIDKDKARLTVVAGEIEGVKGIAPTVSPLLLLRLDLQSEAKLDLPVPKEYSCLLYVLNGQLKIDEQEVGEKEMVWFQNDGEVISIKCNQDSQAILLAGEPIGEEVTSYGPFVMNTSTEIMQAIRDSQQGKMGVLIEEF